MFSNPATAASRAAIAPSTSSAVISAFSANSFAPSKAASKACMLADVLPALSAPSAAATASASALRSPNSTRYHTASSNAVYNSCTFAAERSPDERYSSAASIAAVRSAKLDAVYSSREYVLASSI